MIMGGIIMRFVGMRCPVSRSTGSKFGKIDVDADPNPKSLSSMWIPGGSLMTSFSLKVVSQKHNCVNLKKSTHEESKSIFLLDIIISFN